MMEAIPDISLIEPDAIVESRPAYPSIARGCAISVVLVEIDAKLDTADIISSALAKAPVLPIASPIMVPIRLLDWSLVEIPRERIVPKKTAGCRQVCPHRFGILPGHQTVAVQPADTRRSGSL